jgi:glutathione S-transferase
MTDDLRANLDRLEAMWSEARARFAGSRGPFLFGTFTAADAMYAPVVTRLDTYSLPVAADTRAYMDAVLGHPAYVEWKRGAFAEPWRIAEYEVGHTVIEDLAGPGA